MQEKMLQKKTKRRKEGSGENTTLIWVYDRDTGHLFVVLRFAELPQFLNTVNWGNLSFHHKRHRTESVAVRQVLAPPWEHHWYIEQVGFSGFGLVSSVVFLWRLFVSVSPSVLFHQSHISSSLPNPHLIFFQWIYYHSKTLQGCIHLAPVIWQILSFSIVGLVLRPSIVGYKLGLCMGSHCVLFVDDESRGDSICQFACFLFQVIELLSTNFCFSGTIFFLIFDTDQKILQVQLHRHKLPNLSSNFLPRVEEGG